MRFSWITTSANVCPAGRDSGPPPPSPNPAAAWISSRSARCSYTATAAIGSPKMPGAIAQIFLHGCLLAAGQAGGLEELLQKLFAAIQGRVQRADHFALRLEFLVLAQQLLRLLSQLFRLLRKLFGLSRQFFRLLREFLRLPRQLVVLPRQLLRPLVLRRPNAAAQRARRSCSISTHKKRLVPVKIPKLTASFAVATANEP